MAEDKENISLHKLATATEGDIFIKDGNFIGSDSDIEIAIPARNYKEELWKRMHRQLYECEFAHLLVERNGRQLKFYWQIKESAGPDNNFTVLGILAPIVFQTPLEKIYLRQLCLSIGDGGVILHCSEGSYYIFHFMFTKRSFPQGGKVEDYARNIFIVTGVPPSEYSLNLLDGHKLPEDKRQDRIRGEIGNYQSRRETLTQAQRDAVERIETLDLSPEEKAEELSRLNDYIAYVRDKYDA